MHVGCVPGLWSFEPSVSDEGIPRVDLKNSGCHIRPDRTGKIRKIRGTLEYNVATYMHSRFFKGGSLLYGFSRYIAAGHITIITLRPPCVFIHSHPKLSVPR